jgi:hypothetical protein
MMLFHGPRLSAGRPGKKYPLLVGKGLLIRREFVIEGTNRLGRIVFHL